jgi:hypothetical protein
MTPEQQDLYARIQAFAFDEGEPELPFAGRLSKENGWSKLYSLRVIDEYRKFTFLMAGSRTYGCTFGSSRSGMASASSVHPLVGEFLPECHAADDRS